MADQRRAGLIQVQINGEIHDAIGDFSYNLGGPKRTALVGSDRPHGFSEEPQVPFIEGEIRDRKSLDMRRLVELENATVTLTLANGKGVVLREAWYASEGTARTKEANLGVRFEGASGEEF